MDEELIRELSVIKDEEKGSLGGKKEEDQEN